jgi:hypothetical protein
MLAAFIARFRSAFRCPSCKAESRFCSAMSRFVSACSASTSIWARWVAASHAAEGPSAEAVPAQSASSCSTICFTRCVRFDWDLCAASCAATSASTADASTPCGVCAWLAGIVPNVAPSIWSTWSALCCSRSSVHSLSLLKTIWPAPFLVRVPFRQYRTSGASRPPSAHRPCSICSR